MVLTPDFDECWGIVRCLVAVGGRPVKKFLKHTFRSGKSIKLLPPKWGNATSARLSLARGAQAHSATCTKGKINKVNKTEKIFLYLLSPFSLPSPLLIRSSLSPRNAISISQSNLPLQQCVHTRHWKKVFLLGVPHKYLGFFKYLKR